LTTTGIEGYTYTGETVHTHGPTIQKITDKQVRSARIAFRAASEGKSKEDVRYLESILIKPLNPGKPLQGGEQTFSEADYINGPGYLIRKDGRLDYQKGKGTLIEGL
jgi:hypothetical protein